MWPAIAAIASILSSGAGLFAGNKQNELEEQERERQRKLQLTNYISDRFGQEMYGGGRSWF